MTTKPVLNLTVNDEVKNVVVNGTPYELIQIQRFDLKQIRDFQRISLQMQAFYSVDIEMPDELLDNLDHLLTESIPAILPDLPESLRDRLTILQRMDIMQVFLTESAADSQKPFKEPTLIPTRTTRGAKQSRASSGSMVAP